MILMSKKCSFLKFVYVVFMAGQQLISIQVVKYIFMNLTMKLTHGQGYFLKTKTVY